MKLGTRRTLSRLAFLLLAGTLVLGSAAPHGHGFHSHGHGGEDGQEPDPSPEPFDDLCPVCLASALEAPVVHFDPGPGSRCQIATPPRASEPDAAEPWSDAHPRAPPAGA